MELQRGKTQLEMNLNHRLTDFKDEIHKRDKDYVFFESLGSFLTNNNQEKETL